MGSLYERLGGEAGITELVDAFYDRVLADELLAPYFAGVAMDRLRLMQREFFSAATGGPSAYGGGSLRDVHAGRGIGTRELTRFFDHLVETLGDRGLDRDDVDEIAHRLGLAADDIVGSGPDSE